MSRTRELQILENQIKEYNSNGWLFSFHHRAAIEGSAIVEFAFLIPENKKIIVFSPVVTSSSELTVDWYRNVTLGNKQNNVKDYIINQNQDLDFPSSVQEIWGTPDIQDYGTLNYPDYIPATNQSSAQSIQNICWHPTRGQYYAAKTTNIGNAGIFKFSIFWAEIPIVGG